MARKQDRGTRKAGSTPRRKAKKRTAAARRMSPISQDFAEQQLTGAPATDAGDGAGLSLADLTQRLREQNVRSTVDPQRLLATINRITPEAAVPVRRLPEEIRETLETLRPRLRRLHGAKVSLAWFPGSMVASSCGDRFGYMSSAPVRATTRLPFTQANRDLLEMLGNMMADPGRETSPDTTLPAGFTYVGQFVDHDITFDVSSSLDTATNADAVHNMRTPALDLDSMYGRGPALDPFLYSFPGAGPSTAIKLQLGTNRNTGAGGPAGSNGTPAGMEVQTNFDVPRIHDPLNPAGASHTAVIGDPRNDENLIVVQFHQAMLRFHNRVVDLLLVAGFTGDIFVEAKRIVCHHYQWAVVHDFLRRLCGMPAVTAALNTVSAPIDSPFRMPVEFAVAAYRFGHSLIRDRYWINFNFPNATLAQVFEFNRNPNLPILSSWVVDFNAFFETGVPVPVNNKARRIDSVLANGLESLPGFSGLMAVLATRNLRRGLALGLPSGQGMANFFGITPMTAVQLTQGLPANEIALLNSSGGLLLRRTPLWYYVLREAAVVAGGGQLGPVGARIVAETFARILKRDSGSYLNAAAPFTPSLPSAAAGDFTFADLMIFAGVTQP